MAEDEDDDLYEEEFDFVDDEEDDLDEESDNSEPEEDVDEESDQEPDEAEDTDEYGRPSPMANYVVHVYEYSKFKRTIDRPFTPEDAEAFATEYNRGAKSYGRVAVAGKNDVKPKKSLD
jgi:hypothetical protein